jgi:hypothetical protein
MSSKAVRAAVSSRSGLTACGLVPPGSLAGVPAWPRGQDVKSAVGGAWSVGVDGAGVSC